MCKQYVFRKTPPTVEVQFPATIQPKHTITNPGTNTSIDLSVCQPIVRIGEDVGHSDVLSLVFAVFSESLPCNHDGYRRLGDQVVTERPKQDTATINIMQSQD